MKQQKWDLDELNLLKTYYPITKGTQEIVEIFKNHGKERNYKSLSEKAKYLKIKKLSHKEKIDKILIESYSNSAIDVLLTKVRKYVPYINKRALIARANRLGLQRREHANLLAQKEVKIPKPSKELAWFLGSLAGDGYVSPFPNKWRIYRIRLFVTSKDFAENFGKIGKKLFGIDYFINIYKTGSNKKWKPRYACSFISKRAVEFLGDWKEYAWFKTLIERFYWILKNDSYTASFLSAYFDSDGTVIATPKRCRILIASRNEEVKKMIIKLLKILGINCISYWRAIEISRKEDVQKFARYIKSTIPYKEKKLEFLRKFYG